MTPLSVGIGCRSHSSAAQIDAAVRQALGALGALAFAQIRTVASIDSRATHPGLSEFCAQYALPLTTYSRAQIAAVTLDTPSPATQQHLGVDGVCEPCALLAARTTAGTGRLVVRKTILAGVTVAIASPEPGDAEPLARPPSSTQQDLP
jgi:cobalt-precorrin 5A hydrolase